MLAEYAKLSREAADADEHYDPYLLRLTELEVATRSANALSARIKSAGFPALKDLETYDFSVMPSLSKQKILKLARGRWIDEKTNACFIGNAGTGKTHLSVALGQAACRARPTRPLLHGRHIGESIGGSPEAVPARKIVVGVG